MTKENFKNIIGASKMSQIELGVLIPNYFQKLWNFFTEVQKDSRNLNKDNTSSQQDADMKLDAMDIENMAVILREDLREEFSDCVPAPASYYSISENSQEVLHVTYKAEVYDAKTKNTRISVLSQ
ncbi:unnamed protein product [Parnassius apollo]|uniref:(apollo) hypothetical protein n=1 Tax=Parnassius apollo TaxID=110799 RepID=A0A8S3XFN9_PARAO|nr:unnamed protein product [Parnassius apollo]